MPKPNHSSFPLISLIPLFPLFSLSCRFYTWTTLRRMNCPLTVKSSGPYHVTIRNSRAPLQIGHRPSPFFKKSTPLPLKVSRWLHRSGGNDRLPVGMDNETPCHYSVHSLRNCKIIHLVRHAQGYHNVAGEIDHTAYMSHEYVDASITPLGWKQVEHLRRHLESTDLIHKVELVVTSPMMRTMQTAVGVFGSTQLVKDDQSYPLMVDSGIPFMAVESCREHLGVHPCDKRQSISSYRHMFPGIDFTEIENDEDVLWQPDLRETDTELIQRSKRFLQWLSKRKEREIVVVSHSGFLSHMLRVFGEGCSGSIQKQLKRRFNNCEMRTIVLINQRELGESIPEDYCGGIPPGADITSEALDTVKDSNATT